MYKQFELTENLVKEKRVWLKEKEALTAKLQEYDRVKVCILADRDQLQTSLLKQGKNLEEAISRHIDAKAKYDELRASSALTEAKLLTEVASLQSQVVEQRNINIELLQNNKELREEKAAKGVN